MIKLHARVLNRFICEDNEKYYIIFHFERKTKIMVKPQIHVKSLEAKYSQKEMLLGGNSVAIFVSV